MKLVRLSFFFVFFSLFFYIACKPIAGLTLDNKQSDDKNTKENYGGVSNTPSVVSQQVQRLHIKSGDYSGISYIGQNKYAVVNDKMDGFCILDIPINLNTGKMGIATLSDSYLNSNISHDCEDICFVNKFSSVFIAREGDKSIKEYTLNGKNAGRETGRQLKIPAIFSNASSNYSFESLAYCKETDLFWTTTESTLPQDGAQASYSSNTSNLLRIQSFNNKLESDKQYAYKMDYRTTNFSPTQYAFGVSAITALPDGRLLVLEREFSVGGTLYMASFVNYKIYLVNPQTSKEINNSTILKDLPDSAFMTKKLIYSNRNTLIGQNIANYEGMCLGPKTNDGLQSLILINDSQSNYKDVLYDYILLILLKM